MSIGNEKRRKRSFASRGEARRRVGRLVCKSASFSSRSNNSSESPFVGRPRSRGVAGLVTAVSAWTPAIWYVLGLKKEIRKESVKIVSFGRFCFPLNVEFRPERMERENIFVLVWCTG